MIRKIRFIEPGTVSPYRKSPFNAFTYNKYIKNPSTGLITLATIARRQVKDTLMYSESISVIDWEDVADADIVFVSINTFNAVRGFEIARRLRASSAAVLVFGGMHASLSSLETIAHCDYILTGDADESIVDLIAALDAGRPIDFPGVIRLIDGVARSTGARTQPWNIDTIPDRSLVFGYARLARRYDTLWPQVHASRGCPHRCDYCTIIRHFGRQIRKRTPKNVVEDIRQAIAFHARRPVPRLNSTVWLTDDNFPHDREWAIEVLKEIVSSGINYHFSVQARYEAGFDDELLDWMKRAGFIELALGIEFLDDASFQEYGKKSRHDGIVRAIANIRRHGLGVRGLFIVGADGDTKGIGRRMARFVIDHKLHGALIQSMFFTPGTPVYERSRGSLIHENWEKYTGNVVHYPKNIKPHELQREIIGASRRIYSVPRLLVALTTRPLIFKVLFFGEFLWQISYRHQLRRELPYLRSLPGMESHHE